MENVYCRFCAEPKSVDKLLNLDGIYDEIVQKLDFLNAVYVDVYTQNNLPKTVCFICYDSLNKAYEFLNSVKKAQDVLSNIFSEPDQSKYDLSDDDRTHYEDFLTSENVPDDTQAVKNEISDNISLTEPKVTVKIEPKEEESEQTLTDSISGYNNPSNICDQTLNVQDILGAALNRPFSPNVHLVADCATEHRKNKISSWKEYLWLCGYCNTGFLDADLLRAHAKTSHGKCAAFSCLDCKENLKKEDFTWFIKHVRKHRKNLKSYCQYCDEKINIETDSHKMKKHIKQHFSKTSVQCRACGEIFLNEDELQCHIEMYLAPKKKRKPRRKPGTPITIEDLTCDICKKVYKNPNSLRDHLKRHMTDRKRNYTCDRCGKMFYNKGTLTSHIMTHDQVRPHTCRICNKSFLYPNMLRRHVEMHSGVKPFSCEVCGRCFRLQYQLNAHKIIHTDAMPYVCQYCSKTFRFKQILKNHERQHTGAKPYSCEACGMEFSNWSNYNKHMKRRHNLDTSKKKITPEGVFPVNPLTGQIIQIDTQGMEEWKSKIMIPGKRGKKKVIKQENTDT